MSDGSPLLHDAHHPLPKVGKRIVLLGPHLGVHLLIEFHRQLCERETLVKKKERKENSRQLRYEINTYSFPRFQWHARRRGKALDLDNDEPKFSDQPGRRSCQSSLCI